MFGQTLFADIPFSEYGEPPRVDTGWVKYCKDPCASEEWVKQARNDVPAIPCEESTTKWKVIK